MRNPVRPAVSGRLGSCFLALGALTLAAAAGAGQRGGRTDDSGWDTTLARGDAYDLVFETSEGTWMSVDVSPDGDALVFDLLGHIYRLPVAGGRAVCLTQDSGIAVNYHPRWSPDGTTIAFVSDRGGQSNLWLMDADGGNPRPVHEDPEARVSAPAWLPGGQGIVARKFTVSRPRTAGLYFFHPEGGSGVELVGDDYPRADWPAPSPDDSLYFHFAPSGERDPLRGAMQVRELDLATGRSWKSPPDRRSSSTRVRAAGRSRPSPRPTAGIWPSRAGCPGGRSPGRSTPSAPAPRSSSATWRPAPNACWWTPSRPISPRG